MDYRNMEMREVEAAIQAEEEAVWQEKRAYEAANPVLGKDAVIDEEQSVRWNREEVQRRNDRRGRKVASFRKRLNELSAKGDEEAKRRVKEEYDLNEATANIVFAKAYEDGHSGGLCEVYNKAVDLAGFALDILEVNS